MPCQEVERKETQTHAKLSEFVPQELVSYAAVLCLVTQRSSVRKSVAWRDKERLRRRLHRNWIDDKNDLYSSLKAPVFFWDPILSGYAQ